MVYVALEDIRSLYNVGAIFRTCSFFGISDVLLVGYTAKDANGALHKNVLKSSVGSEKDLNIIHLAESADLIKFAQNNDLELISIEQDKSAKSLKKYVFPQNCILVFGNEVTGVSQEILKNSVDIVQIDKPGKHASLNVTTVVGIVLEKVV